MWHGIWIAVIVLISANLVRNQQSTDEFYVEKNNSISYPSYSNESVVVAAQNGKYCFAYRTSNTRLVFGFGSVDLPLTFAQPVSSSDLFTLGAVEKNCYLFYAIKQGSSSYLLYVVTDVSPTSPVPTQGHLVSIFTFPAYAMNVVADPNDPSNLVVGISYYYNGAKLALIRCTISGLQFSDIDLDIPFTGVTSIARMNLLQYGIPDTYSVVLETPSAIWTGTTLSTTGYFSAYSTLAKAGVAVTSQLFNNVSGVVCFTLSASVYCHDWNPTEAAITAAEFFTHQFYGSNLGLGRLANDPTAAVLISRDTDGNTITAYQLKTNTSNPLNVTFSGTNVFFTLSNADANNLLAMLVRDESSGVMQLLQIRHNFCGDGIKNSREVCDGEPNCSSDCLSFLSTPQVLSSPFSQIPASPIDSKTPLNAPSDSIGNAPTTEGPPASVLVPAIVVPVVVVAAGLIILLVLLRRRKKRKGSLLHGKSRVEIAMESIDDRLKIPYNSLVFKKEIGAGSYGKVYVGEWKGTPVAIKVSSSVTDMDGFFDEARITVGLQQHPNVVQTFGVSLDGQLPCIVLEFCEGGSLDNRLFDSDVTLTPQQKVALIKGIARGLYHLHSNNIVHRDLAARNVLLNKSGTPKISDFGMSRVLKSEAEKGKTRTNYGPIRWMAPESLRDLQYSTKSDVWSFGIVLYEIVSRNEPHIDIDPLEVAVKIKNEAYHPTVPQNVDPVLREIMLSCWQPDPNNRPSMEQICNKLNSSFPDE